MIMKLDKILLIVILLVVIGCTTNENGAVTGPNVPFFDGIGNLRYNPTTQSLDFEGYKKNYFLNIDSQVKDELIFFDDKGSYLLEYPGRYYISLLNGKDTVGVPVTFYKDKNYGSKFIYNTNLTKNGFEEPLFGTLNDGLLGSVNPRDGQWWCWENENAAIVIDLGDQFYIENISFRYYEDIDQNIFAPSSIKLSGSYDGIDFTTFSIKSNFMPADYYFKKYEVPVNNNFRYYRVDLFAHSTDKSETASKSYLLVDEIFLKEGKNPFTGKNK